MSILLELLILLIQPGPRQNISALRPCAFIFWQKRNSSANNYMGCTKLRNEIETQRTKQNEKKRNITKRNEVKQKHHVRSKWNKNIMYAPSETKTSCTLQVKQKHHVRFKWNKDIMYAPSETQTPCTLHVHDVFVSFGAYMMFLFHLERTWYFCFTWSVHDVFVKRLEIQTIYDVIRNKKTKDINRIAKQSGTCMVTWTRRIILDLIIEILMEILITNIRVL
jgi:hypothetical protein